MHTLTFNRQDLFNKLVDQQIIPKDAVYDYEIDYFEEPYDDNDNRDDTAEIAENNFRYINYIEQSKLNNKCKWFMIYHFNATNEIHYAALEMGRVREEKPDKTVKYYNVVRTASLISRENELLKYTIPESKNSDYEYSIKYTNVQ